MLDTMNQFNWNADKNRTLIKERGKSFEEVVFHINRGGLLDDPVIPMDGIILINGFLWLVLMITLIWRLM